ncbi:hypothetical protein CDD83_812 [Cordyceps sp. RAO-2017]|nr:hypothetical protein CDD83_812 [Cordyceps sp. RAO-2017]
MRLGLRTCLVAAAVFAGLCECFDHEFFIRATDTSPLAAAPAKYPACSRDCLSQKFAASSCNDAACLCGNRTFEKDLKDCVMPVCPIYDSMAVKNLTDKACHRPRRDKSGKFSALSIALCSITYVLVAVRIVYKQFFGHRRRLSVDDWIIMVTVAIGIPCTVLNVHGLAANGIGKDVWTLQPQTVSNFQLYFYVLEIFYVTMMALIRVALCFFYLHIFPGVRIRRVLWGTVVFNALFGFAAAIATIFQCTPIRYFWVMYKERFPRGHCINMNVLGWVHGALNIAINLWLISIALNQVRKLDLHWKKKLSVSLMFLTGIFDTVVSVLRLHSLIHFANSWNPTWDQFGVAWWSTIEIEVGLLCTCMPTLRIILVRMFPRLLGTDRSSKESPNPGSDASGGIMVQKQIRVDSVDNHADPDAAAQDRAKLWELGSEGAAAEGPHAEAYS